MSVALRVLIVTDAFPPNCGGSGWSTWELTRALFARGHHVHVVKVEAGLRHGVTEGSFQGIGVTTYRKHAPNVPLVRNWIKNERLWSELTWFLTDRLRKDRIDIVHGQHVMTVVPSIRAGRRTGTPVVATVRDYWPVCYWSNLIIDPESPQLCPACSTSNMTRCIRPRSGALWPLALPVIPYMRANLRTKRRDLARANAVIAVSSTIARDLRRRALELAATPLYTIPNALDIGSLDDVLAHAPAPMDGPYVLYAGKLAINKGAQFLLPAIHNAGIDWPVVIAGDGPLKATMMADARARGLNVRFTNWLDRHDVLAWMRHASLLAFPSFGPESLSRVLIEAAALGVPIAAMDTGGTRDILTPDVTALLSADVGRFTADLARLWRDPALCASLGEAARADIRRRFDATSVAEQVEHVYRSLLPAPDGSNL